MRGDLAEGRPGVMQMCYITGCSGVCVCVCVVSPCLTQVLKRWTTEERSSFWDVYFFYEVKTAASQREVDNISRLVLLPYQTV